METSNAHYQKLERMYLSAPVNTEIYNGITIEVSDEKAQLTLKVQDKFFHAAHAIHGSVYFKMLDDAAFFAVNSIVKDVFVYTVSFNIQLLRPVSNGLIKAVGEVKFKSKNLFIADAILYDEKGRAVGRGSGNFMKSKIELTEEIGYK
ncbi:PaaI family thioesterase [Flavobacterium sp.]|uniref:PaaI family thioesterase n=1 Tax=Flavobacterium sp. TaxID=239 RepID=UPI00286C27C8|nr:PaaI family thioesterase [Flavobacterium sp.]